MSPRKNDFLLFGFKVHKKDSDETGNHLIPNQKLFSSNFPFFAKKGKVGNTVQEEKRFLPLLFGLCFSPS